MVKTVWWIGSQPSILRTSKEVKFLPGVFYSQDFLARSPLCLRLFLPGCQGDERPCWPRGCSTRPRPFAAGGR